ncbi:hypothetical protein ACR782_19030 [Sphingobacterium spiritivorum]|uniref:hypothetical protein n=1 Tax=Sphingobacterium spiritivorum TaxID=258 RepID=UPI003DA39715
MKHPAHLNIHSGKCKPFFAQVFERSPYMVKLRLVYYQKSVVGIGENLNFNREVLAVVPFYVQL